MPRGLIFILIDYIELIDWTGRIIRDDKRGFISGSAPSILQRLNISTKHWIELTTKFEQRFKGISIFPLHLPQHNQYPTNHWLAVRETRTSNRNQFVSVIFALPVLVIFSMM